LETVTQENINNASTAATIYTLPNPSGSGTYALTYFYDADGNKLRRVSTQGAGSNTDYIDGIEYDNGALNFIQTDEGRVVNNGGSYNYEYNLSDHLGNTRVTYSIVSNVATMIQQDDYYPFGMDIQASTTNPENYYLYNKKELQPDLGQYDYGAHFYDPVIGRWTSVDPLAEQYRRWSVYNYGDDNSIRFEDPDGMGVWDNVVSYAKGLAGDLSNAAEGISNLLEDPTPLVKATNNPRKALVNLAINGSKALVKTVHTFKHGTTTEKYAAAGMLTGEGLQLFGGDITELGEASKIGTGAIESVNDGEKIVDKAGELPEPGKGKGSVSPADRDPKRTWTKTERSEMLENQEGKCAKCGTPKSVDEVQAHHKVRHADGGRTNGSNGAALCKECHVQIHQ